MIASLLADAATSSPSPAGLLSDQIVSKGLELTNLVLLYVGLALVIYFLMMLAGRVIKRRFNLPLGWFYQLFSFSMALFVPSLLTKNNKDIDNLEIHIHAAVILTGAFVAISVMRHYLFEVATNPGETSFKVPKFLTQVISLAVVLVAIGIVVRFVYGGDVSGLLTGAGIVGIVLGLAAQETLSNIFSGFAIYFGGQFKSGDWLQIGEHHAEIMEVNWRSTRLRTTDEVYLDIPNSSITKETLVNYTHPTRLHAMRMEIGVDYDSPPTKVKQVLVEAALMAQYVSKDRTPTVFLKDFGDWSITYQIKFWMDDHSRLNETLSDIRTNLWYALRRHDISIPYPIQTEMHYQMPAKKGTDRQLVREALSKVFFHECLSEPQVERLVGSASMADYGRGEQLILQGEDGASMFVITEGRADVVVEIGGAPRSVAQISAGDCLGEMSLLTGEKRSATIVALSDMSVVELDKETLAPIIAESPELLERLSDMLARRRMQNEGVAVAQAMSATQLAARQQDYRSNFLNKLKSFFKI
ncbi:mechanosensitive ion channel family protein [soil metagenome]